MITCQCVVVKNRTIIIWSDEDQR